MSKQERRHLVPVKAISTEFDYGSLKPTHAEKLRTAAMTIKEKIDSSLRGLIEAGQGLLAVKKMLPHGQFLPWIEAEFGWTDRTARRLMEVADQFGSKSDIMSDLHITTTALYHLAAPSTPFAARQIAIDRATAGERITPAVATQIIASVRRASSRKQKLRPTGRLAQALRLVLKRFQKQFGADRALEFARELHEYASSLERENRAGSVKHDDKSKGERHAHSA
jgi:hypothetical protein